MSISNSLLNWYIKIKQVLDDSNVALVNRGLNKVNNLFQISAAIEKLGIINHLPYLLRNELLEITIGNIGEPTNIGNYAFNGCTSLTSVTIPDNVTTIGNYAFVACSRLRHIYLRPTIPPSLGHTNAIPAITTIHVPVGYGDAYKTATNWSYYSDRIVEDIAI